MIDFSHLDALQARLRREIERRDAATNDNARDFRIREITSCEKEIANEYKFLGIEPLSLDDILMSDDELLAELSK